MKRSAKFSDLPVKAREAILEAAANHLNFRIKRSDSVIFVISEVCRIACQIDVRASEIGTEFNARIAELHREYKEKMEFNLMKANGKLAEACALEVSKSAQPYIEQLNILNIRFRNLKAEKDRADDSIQSLLNKISELQKRISQRQKVAKKPYKAPLRRIGQRDDLHLL